MRVRAYFGDADSARQTCAEIGFWSDYGRAGAATFAKDLGGQLLCAALLATCYEGQGVF